MAAAHIWIERIVDPSGLPISNKRFSKAQVRSSIFRILKGNVLCSIATVTRENRAHINTAYFCYSDDLELYFLSDYGSVHCRNLSTNSSMAMTIFSSSQKWGNPDRGMQLFGTCSQARGHQATIAERLYGKRFPAYPGWMAGLSDEEKRRVSRYCFYRFLPSRIKILAEEDFGAAVFVIAAVTRSRGSK